MPINGKPTYYEFYGLENFEPDPLLIKRAYRSMALKWHPDRCEDKVNAERMFKQVSEIYEVLIKKKDSYDRYLRNKMQGEQQTQTNHQSWSSSNAWSNPTWSFDMGNIDEMIRKMREEERREQSDQMFSAERQIKLANIHSILNRLKIDELTQVEDFINFIRRK